MDEIKVGVIKRRGKFYLRYFDTNEGRYVERATKATKRSDAEREAGKWQAELREGRYAKQSKMTWQTFREFYRENALAALADRSLGCYESTLNVLEKACRPQKLADVTTARVLAFVKHLRSEGRAEATIHRHLRHLKAAMRWAHRHDLLTVLPHFTMPKRVKGAKVMRGRPITGEEFDRMLEVVPKVVENAAAESWKFYLRGLWESGLRLTESLTLRWDDGPDAIVVDFSGRRPMLRIESTAQKSNRDELLPMTPEFAALLMTVPESERRGRVFKLLRADGSPFPAETTQVSHVVSHIGKEAGVMVDERTKMVKDKGGKPQKVTVRKYASAHDLRRAFGQRWSRKIKPQDLQKLMRHASLTTTFTYYVTGDAEAIADAVWQASSDSFGDSSHSTDFSVSKANSKHSTNQG